MKSHSLTSQRNVFTNMVEAVFRALSRSGSSFAVTALQCIVTAPYYSLPEVNIDMDVRCHHMESSSAHLVSSLHILVSSSVSSTDGIFPFGETPT